MTTKLALVTGGGQGIGRCIVEHLLGLNWRVAALDLDAEALAELKDHEGATRLLTLRADVGKEGEIARAFERLVKWQADAEEAEGLDLLVNNAGIARPYNGPIEDMSLADWRRYQDSHVTGAFLCTRSAVPLLRKRKGAIVNMVSTRAFQSEPETEAYVTAKGAQVAFTHALAVSLGPDIRANAIAPGWIEVGPWRKASLRKTPKHSATDRKQHPVGRVGEPQDIAALVAFLASDGAGFITGQTFVADGGISKKMIYAE